VGMVGKSASKQVSRNNQAIKQKAVQHEAFTRLDVFVFGILKANEWFDNLA
jgi:hypothetical protein